MADSVEKLLGELQREIGTIDVENRWRVILNRFAADIVNGVLPDDPFARQAVVRKAEAMGIDIGVETGTNVVRLADRVRSKAVEGGVMAPDQLAALNEIGEHLDDLILEARVAKLRTLAASLEDIRGSLSKII